MSRRTRFGCRIRTSSGRSSSAGSSRPRSRGRSWRSIRSISPTSRRRRTRRAKCSREARTRRSTRTAMDELLEAQAQATTCSCRRSSIRRGERGRERVRPTRGGGGGSVRPGSRPPLPALDRTAPQGRAEHRHLRAGRRRPGEELPIPGKDFGFRRLIAAQAAGDYEALKERGRRVARIPCEACGSEPQALAPAPEAERRGRKPSLWLRATKSRSGGRDEARDGRTRPDGARDDRAAARRRARGDDVRPRAGVHGVVARRAEGAARAAARRLDDDPGRRHHRADDARTARPARRRRRARRRRQLEPPRLAAAA